MGFHETLHVASKEAVNMQEIKKLLALYLKNLPKDPSIKTMARHLPSKLVLMKDKRLLVSILAKSTDFRLRAIAAFYANDSKILNVLCKDPNIKVRIFLTYNSLSGDNHKYFDILAKDPNYLVRLNVVKNSLISPKMLHLLAQDKEEIIRKEVAFSSRLLPKTFRLLSNDTSSEVRISIARNEFTPRSLLDKMARKTTSLQMKMAIAKNISTDSKTISLLAQDSNVEVRLRAAWNINATDNTLKLLSKDADPLVRAKVAKRPDIPERIPKVFLKLALDADFKVKLAVVDNYYVTKQILMQMLNMLAFVEPSKIKEAKKLQKAILNHPKMRSK